MMKLSLACATFYFAFCLPGFSQQVGSKPTASLKFDESEPSGLENGQIMTLTLTELKSKYLKDEFNDTPQFFIETEIEHIDLSDSLYQWSARPRSKNMGIDVAGDYSRVYVPNQSGIPLYPNEIIFSLAISEANSIMTNLASEKGRPILSLTFTEDDYIGNDHLKGYYILLDNFLKQYIYYRGDKDVKGLRKSQKIKPSLLMKTGLVELRVNENLYAIVKVDIK